MKKKTILIIVIAVLLAAVLSVIILIPKDNSSVSFEVFRAESNIKTYLKSVIKGNYEKAVNYVSFFDGKTDETVPATPELEEAWIKAIDELAQKDIYLTGYSDLDVRTVDGIIKCSVTLIVNDVGSNQYFDIIPELTVDSDCGLFDVKYRIKDVTDEELRLEIENVLSGIILE